MHFRMARVGGLTAVVLLCFCFTLPCAPRTGVELVFVAGAACRRWGLPPPAWPASLLICTSGGGLGLLLLLTYRGQVDPFISLPMCLERVALMYSAAFAGAFLLLLLFFRQVAVPGDLRNFLCGLVGKWPHLLRFLVW